MKNILEFKAEVLYEIAQQTIRAWAAGPQGHQT
jgi:hypothetical protein